jgi:hypothetical protein
VCGVAKKAKKLVEESFQGESAVAYKPQETSGSSWRRNERRKDD